MLHVETRLTLNLNPNIFQQSSDSDQGYHITSQFHLHFTHYVSNLAENGRHGHVVCPAFAAGRGFPPPPLRLPARPISALGVDTGCSVLIRPRRDTGGDCASSHNASPPLPGYCIICWPTDSVTGLAMSCGRCWIKLRHVRGPGD